MTKMGFFPGQQVPKTILQGESRPRAIRKETGEMFLLVRDDTAVNGKLYIAPVGAMTSMQSIRPEQFKAEFEWYVEPKDRPVPVREVDVQNQMFANVTPTTQAAVDATNIPQVHAGGPIGPWRPKGGEQITVTPEPTGADVADYVEAAVAETSPPEEPVAIEAGYETPVPKKRGRPKGSKNKKKRKT